jgi:hypothetical protein
MTRIVKIQTRAVMRRAGADEELSDMFRLVTQ